MAERPILMSEPMVCAILDGRKTQTRRVVKITHRTPGLAACLEPFDPSEVRPKVAAELCPYGAPGDRLWVRETWAAPHFFDGHAPSAITRDAHIHFAASEKRGGLLWRPSIHMPRWASRITLDVTGVRVERVQEISHEDAIAEGCAGHDWVASSPYIAGPHTDAGELPDEEFQRLWSAINGPESWAANPWVWVVEFRRI